MLKYFLFIFILSSNKQCPQKLPTKMSNVTYVKLDMESPILVGCGGFQLAYGFLFKNEIDSLIICIVRCPYEYGEGFFKKNFSYKAKLSLTNITDSLKDYVVENPFMDDNIPTYLITEISKGR